MRHPNRTLTDHENGSQTLAFDLGHWEAIQVAAALAALRDTTTDPDEAAGLSDLLAVFKTPYATFTLEVFTVDD